MWMKGVAILFAVGAVSGTVLSFELGLLWPGFMAHAGAIIGMPFSWEGTAFFIEAVAIGLFLYGWNRMPPWIHWGTGLVVGLSGFVSGIFVVAANAWMNAPAGFDWIDGMAHNVDPVRAMFNRAWLHQSLHMQLAALQAVGFAVAGVHAWLYLRGRAKNLNLKALRIAMVFGRRPRCCSRSPGTLPASAWPSCNRRNWRRWRAIFTRRRGRRCSSAACPTRQRRP
jgi:cytochrome d ubiquinol oxidase subunit I